MSRERTRKFHSPATEKLSSLTAELVPARRPSLPCTARTATEGCRDKHHLSQPASETSPSPEGQRAGLTARPAAEVLPAAHPQEKVPHTASNWLLWQAFGQPSVPCLCGQPLLSFMYCGSWATVTHASHSGLDRLAWPTWEASDLQSFSFNTFQVLLLSARLQHLLTKIPPLPTTVRLFGNKLQHSNLSVQVLPVKCIHKTSHKYRQPDEPLSTRKTEITSMNL